MCSERAKTGVRPSISLHMRFQSIHDPCMQALRAGRLSVPTVGRMLLSAVQQHASLSQSQCRVPQLINLREFGKHTCVSSGSMSGSQPLGSCSNALPRQVAVHAAVLQRHVHQQAAQPAVSEQVHAGRVNTGFRHRCRCLCVHDTRADTAPTCLAGLLRAGCTRSHVHGRGSGSSPKRRSSRGGARGRRAGAAR